MHSYYLASSGQTLGKCIKCKMLLYHAASNVFKRKIVTFPAKLNASYNLLCSSSLVHDDSHYL